MFLLVKMCFPSKGEAGINQMIKQVFSLDWKTENGFHSIWEHLDTSLSAFSGITGYVSLRSVSCQIVQRC